MIGNIFGQLIGNSVASDNQYQQSLQHQMQAQQDYAVMQNQYYRRMNKVDYETWAKAFPKVGPTELELEQHAALKDAWDQYNTIRALCGLSVKL